MAYSNGLKSPRDEASYQAFPSPMRTVSNQYVPQLPSTSTERASLNRRFTTNAINTLPTLSSLQSPLSPIGQQRRQAAEQHDFGTTGTQKTPSNLREHQQRELAEQLKLSSLRARQEAEMLEEQYRRLTSPGGHTSSEPTTPPDLQDSSLASTAFTSRSNRFSLGLTSPIQPSTNSFHRNTLSGSQHSLGLFSYSSGQTSNQNHRKSDDLDEEDAFGSSRSSTNRRAAVRNSMPVTNFEYRGMSPLPDVGDVLGINSLLDDDDDYHLPTHRQAASIDRSGLHLDTHDDDFLSLLKRQGESSSSGMTAPGLLSHNDSSTLPSGGWPNYSRHRQGQKSLPMNTLRATEEDIATPTHSRNSSIYDSSARMKTNNRHSMDVSFNAQNPQSNRSSIHMSPTSGNMPNLRSSLSTNDIPTIGSLSLADSASIPNNSNMSHEQRLHNHNATLGRIPPNAVNHRRDASIGDRRSLANQGPTTTNGSAFTSGVTGANTSASSGAYHPAYLPHGTQNSTLGNYASSYLPPNPAQAGTMSFANVPSTQNPVSTASRSMGYTGSNATQNSSYGSNHVASQMHNAQSQWNGNSAMQYGNYPQYYYQQQYQMPRPPRDSQQWVIAQRRGQKHDDPNRGDNRFTGTTIEDHIGKIFEVSKDQNGCRFLQKKIEEDKAKNLPIIFNETKDHIVELMKDPFGNYLCQKLLENCDSSQRAILINNAAPSMVEIAVNQHGTRALQKMIEYVTTPDDVDVIVRALSTCVVSLIQDLNGNHVVQKCLNHLRPENAQFIFDAVGSNALTVGSHRHGCCVLQRCIDHATGAQKDKLVSEITSRAYTLMQDAYGNYVIQYILDLNDAKYTGPLCECFAGNVVELSRQKFSSNVIEKSLRMADVPHQRQMIQELYIEGSELEKLLRDPFSNYVVQTALEHGPLDMQDRLWEIVRSILPNIRGTPCGRRLAQKLAQRDGNQSGHTSGTMTPKEGIMPSPNNFGPSNVGMYSNGFNTPTNTGMAGLQTNSNHTMGGAHMYHNVNSGGIPSVNNMSQQSPHIGNNSHANHVPSRNGSYLQYPNGFF